MSDMSPGVLGFLFGFFDTDEVPGPLLVRAMTDLGVAEPATRTLLSRMIKEGSLVRRREGRIALYSLAGTYRRNFQTIRHAPGPVEWAGSYEAVIHHIPERHRARRDALRRAAEHHGFGSLRPGVLIGLTPTDWVARLDHGSDLIECVHLACERDAARRLAHEAWHLGSIAADLLRERDRLAARLADPTTIPDGPAALRSLRTLWMDHASLMLRAPRLPREFLPSDWAASEVRSLTISLAQRHREPIAAYEADLIGSSPYGHLLT